MFDELHDQTPPSGDSHQFAAVAERAAAIRRRRRTAVGTLSAVALLGGGAIVASTIGADTSTIATLDASEPMQQIPATDGPATASSVTPSTIPPSPSTTAPVPPTAAAPTSTVASATTTSLVEVTPSPTVPVTVPPVSPIVGDPIPLQCGGFRVCTFENLADGRLVQIGKDGSESGPPTYSIYDETGTTVEATGLLGNFDPLGAFLIDVGPGDIAYVWYLNRDETETARMGAFELTGPNAGSQIIEFDAVLDFSGDTEQVPTRDGFVNVGCCGADTVRPAPDAEVVIPWVDRDGNTITNDDDTFFTTEFIDQNLSIAAIGNGIDQSWDFPEQESGPRGLPALHPLEDGPILYIFEPLHSGGARPIPAYLNPDGSVAVGSSPGIILHVLPDGRVVLRDMQAQTYLLAALAPPTSDAIELEEPSPSTTVGPDDSTVARPLVAINTDGDAVHFADDDTNPTLIFDGPEIVGPTIGDGPNGVDRVAYSGVHDMYSVGLCCSPIVGTILSGTADQLPIGQYLPDPEPEHVELDGYGYAPTFDSQGGRLAAIGPNSEIVISDTAPGFSGSIEFPDRAGDAWDLVWIDPDRVGVLGRFDNVWTLTVVRYAVSVGDDPLDWLTIESSRSFGLTSNFDDLRFAGTAVDGEIAVHDLRTDRMLTGTVDDYGNNNGDERGSSLQVITLPGPAQSAWYFDPGQLIWVDADNVLRVGDRIVLGEYIWARR